MGSPAIVVVGAGTAGLEGLLAARERFGEGAELCLVAPDGEFRYRPATRSSLFRPAPERALAVGEIASSVGARWVRDRADLVDERAGVIVTRDGDTIGFDFLLLAVGGHPLRALHQGHIWRRGGDPGFLDEIRARLAAQEIRSVGIAVPRGSRWPVPAYELALVLAWTAAAAGARDARVTLLTAEQRPLGALGMQAAETVTRELAHAGVEALTSVEVADPRERSAGRSRPVTLAVAPQAPSDEWGALLGAPSDPAELRSNSDWQAEFDRLISLPSIRGPAVAGVSTDAAGFVEVDETLKVCSSERVWAAGTAIAAGLEHSALSARQADAATAAMAAAAGVLSGEPPAPPQLVGMILSGQRERWLAENPLGTPQPSTRCLWWPPGRAVGRLLARRITAWDPAVDEHALSSLHAQGVLVRAPVALGCSERPSVTAPVAESDDPGLRAARIRDIANRQLLAVERREREAEAEVRALSAGLRVLADHQQEAIKELREHGYLADRDGVGARPRTRPGAS